MRPFEVGILGATGVVGQQFVARLARHPWFRPTWLAASERSEGKPYGSAAPWRLAVPIPDESVARPVEACTPGRGPRVVFSALDASVAGDIEQAFAAAGHFVVSNARNYRMDPLVPLLIPEINADHLQLVPEQQKVKGWRGAIVTNPNCSTVVLAMSLAPLCRFGLTSVFVSTMQAVSGAGYPGVPSLDILGNVVPFIAGEEEKVESETLKILGRDGGREPHPAVVSAHTNRTHHDDLRRARGETRPRRGDRGDARVPRPPAGARLAECAAAANRRRHRQPSPAAAARRGSRRRDGGHDRPRPPMPDRTHQIRRARPQHRARRRRRRDPQR
jgi:aspartate-semialdehyde dehydrogenase